MTSTNDLRTRLLATVPSFGRRNPPHINPDGPEAVAALDERDERIKALEAGLQHILDGALSLPRFAEEQARNLLTNPTPAKE